MLVDAGQIKALAPSAAAGWPEALAREMPRWGIDNAARCTMFLAQVCHESQGLTRFAENLNYSAEGLMATWPKRFPTLEIAQRFARKPEAIANMVYAGRMGNGPETTGDGYAFRGRSPIQLTGRDAYREAGAALEYPLETLPNDAATPPIGAAVACWYWKSRGCNELADAGSWLLITRAINGGYIGQFERDKWLRRAQDILGAA